MKKSLFIILFLLSTGLLFSSCNKKLKTKTLTITTKNNKTFKIEAELAITPEERQHGFMERKKIPDNTGMLFIWDKDQVLSFWMKNTPHPLSIAYIDSKGQIRDIFDMKPYSLESIVSTVSVRYALEVPQGWFEKNNINPGDYISLDF